MTVPAGAGRVDVGDGPRPTSSAGSRSTHRTAGPTLHELVVTAVVDGRVDGPPHGHVRAAHRARGHRRGRARPAPRGQRPPGLREGRQLHPVAALRRGRPLVLRPRHATDRRGARELDRGARARAVAPRLRRRRCGRGPDVPGLPAPVVLRQRHRDQPRVRRRGRSARSPRWPTCSTPIPSVVYYACHNEPLRMFVPTRPEDDGPDRDVGERHLDAALFATLAVDRRLASRARGVGHRRRRARVPRARSSGRNLYRVSELPGVVRERVRLLDGRAASGEVRRHRLAARRPRRCASG